MKTIQALLSELETKNDVISKFQLGYLYDKGELVYQDDAKAFEYYQQAAAIDVSEQSSITIKYKIFALHSLGLMYFYGRGVAENKQRGLEIIKQIAKKGHAEANYFLGNIYATGDGVKQNYQESEKHYLLAAEKNHAEAQFNLGKLYFEKLINNISEKNSEVIAKKYFELAKKNGCVQAENYLKDLVSFWPSEDWDLLLKPNDCKLSSKLLEEGLVPTGPFAAQASQAYGNKNKKLIREELKMLVTESERMFVHGTKEFALEELLEKYQETFKTSIDKNLIIWLNMIVEQGLNYGHYIMGYYYAQEMRRHSFKLKKIFDELEKNNVYTDEKNISNESALSKKDYKNIYIYYILQYVRASSYLKRALLGGMECAKGILNELNAYKKHLNYIDFYWHNLYELCLMSELLDKDTIENGKIYVQENAIKRATVLNSKPVFEYKYILKDLQGKKKEGSVLYGEEDYRGTFTKQILNDEKSTILEIISRQGYIRNPKKYEYKIYPWSDCLSELEPYTELAFSNYSTLAKEDDDLFEKIQAIVEAVRLFNQKNHSKKIISVLPDDLESLLLQHINNNDLDEYKRWVALLIDKQQVSHFHMLFCERAIETKRLDIVQRLFMLESFDINSVITKLKMTPLEFLIDQGDVEGLQQLIITRKDLDINLNNPLLQAVLGEQVDVVALLLSHPAINVNAGKELGGPSPLWLAAKHGLLEVLQELLMHPKLYVNYQCSKLCAKETEFLKEIGKDKMNVREVALCYQHQEVIDLLQAHKQTLLRRRAAEQQQNVHAVEPAVNATNGPGDRRPANLHFMFANYQQQQKFGDPASSSLAANQPFESDNTEIGNVVPMSPLRAKLGT